MTTSAPGSRLWRYAVLVSASAMLFGSYFAYDSVAAIEDSLREAFGADREAIGFMYTMYSLAAVPTVFVGGFLTDRLGTRRSSLLFSAILTAGAALVALAPSLPVLYAGRLLFGIGSESLVVAQSAILARWFKGKELALAFGLALAVSRLGTLFTFNTEALIAERAGFRAALWTAAVLCLAGLGFNAVYAVLDRRAAPLLGLRDAASDPIALRDVRHLGAPFWYVALLCVTFYSAIFPFTALSTDFFAAKWELPRAAASGLGFWEGIFQNITHPFSTAQGTSAIPITASLLLAAPAGWLVDRIGGRARLMILGSLLLVPAHLLLGLTTFPPAYAMILLGVAFVLVPAAMWPAIPLVVDEKRVGSAFGITTMIQNIGLATLSWTNGALRDATESYVASQLLFAALGVAGLAFGILLWRSDRKSGGVLERAAPRQ